jgi:hypothetical protein
MEHLSILITILLSLLGLVVTVVIARTSHLRDMRTALREELAALKREVLECNRRVKDYEVNILHLSRENDRLRAELGEVLSILYRAGMLPERRGPPKLPGND